VTRGAVRVYMNRRRVDVPSRAIDTQSTGRERQTMLWTIFVILVILWLLGFSFNVGGGLIHILLVIALVVLVYNLIMRRRG
jgi:hypothetical protein